MKKEENFEMKKEEIKKLKEFRRWFGKYISRNFGKKCSDFTWDCSVCHAYFVKDLFDDFVENLIDLENWSKKQDKKGKN